MKKIVAIIVAVALGVAMLIGAGFLNKMHANVGMKMRLIRIVLMNPISMPLQS